MNGPDEDDSADGLPERAAGEASPVFPMPVDLSFGLAVEGHLTERDRVAATTLSAAATSSTGSAADPPPKKPSRTSGCAMVLFILPMLILIVVLLDDQPRQAPPAAANGPATHSPIWYGVGFVLSWALYFLVLKFALPGPPRSSRPCRYLFQDAAYYEYDDIRLAQCGWAGNRLVESAGLRVIVGDGNSRQPIPRRFCRDDAEWSELGETLRRRLPATELPEPQKYPNLAGPHEDVAIENVWTAKVFQSPVIGRSTGMWSLDDARALLPNYNRRSVAGLAASAVGAAAVAWFAPETSAWKLTAVGAVVGWSVLAWFVWRGDREGRRTNELLMADRTDIVTTVRESGVELSSPRGMSFYLWKGLARGPVTEEQIGLHVEQTELFLVLAKRLFAAQEWRRIVDRVTALPLGRFSMR